MAPPANAAIGMGTYAARLATFQQPHQLSKRRASSLGGGKKKKNDHVVEWPHERPSGEDDSLDNVQCYFCEVKLDGWEPEDDAVKEHLAHAPHCAWATCVSALKKNEEEEKEDRDPMSDTMVAARTFTFNVGDGWIHENKRGWKCKIDRMVDAGWVFDPSPDTEDGVTCMHCNLSLDGWEPKDDPAGEHKRRSPDCRFFILVERYHGSLGTESKKKRVGGGSNHSKTGRHSVQSAMSTFSDDLNVTDLNNPGHLAEVDDSVLTTASTATVKATKKKSRQAKAAKSAKSQPGVSVEDENAVSYPDLDVGGEQRNDQLSGVRPTRAVRQQSKLSNSSIVGRDTLDAGYKQGRRESKDDRLETPDNQQETRLSDASAQLQEELDVSLGPVDESTPRLLGTKRGAKRTSDGVRKGFERDSNIVIAEFPTPPQPTAKSKRVRKPKQSTEDNFHLEGNAATTKSQQVTESTSIGDEDMEMPEPTLPKATKATKQKKVAAKKTKGKKTSSARSSRATARSRSPDPDPAHYNAEDMARDEMEIEIELERIAAEQNSAIGAEQERETEFEASPSHAQIHADKIHELELELL
nr:protein bir1 [Quercus suber]